MMIKKMTANGDRYLLVTTISITQNKLNDLARQFDLFSINDSPVKFGPYRGTWNNAGFWEITLL